MKATYLLLVGIVFLATPEPAQAYCRTRTCDRTRNQCVIDPATDCVTSGEPLSWSKQCTSYAIQKDGAPSRQIQAQTVAQVARNAFTRWLAADCGDGTTPDIEVADLGLMQCAEIKFSEHNANANVILFRDKQWPHESMSNSQTLALTTVTYRSKTGEILGADIEINSAQHPFSVGNVNASEVDLESVLTHEIGHFLGLSHSHIPEATMNQFYHPGDTSLASLDADDKAGICETYPKDRKVAAGDCRPTGGYSQYCNTPPDPGACALSAKKRPPKGNRFGVVYAAALFSLFLRRRRPARKALAPLR